MLGGAGSERPRESCEVIKRRIVTTVVPTRG
jgi:hypothetical protein